MATLMESGPILPLARHQAGAGAPGGVAALAGAGQVVAGGYSVGAAFYQRYVALVVGKLLVFGLRDLQLVGQAQAQHAGPWRR